MDGIGENGIVVELFESGSGVVVIHRRNLGVG